MGKNQDHDSQNVCLLIEPADPLVERQDWRWERDIPLHCIDVDLDDYPNHGEQLPIPMPSSVSPCGLLCRVYEGLRKRNSGTT